VTTTWYSDPANFEASRAAFYKALRVHGIRSADATTAADLFAEVIGRTMAELVPEEMDQLRDTLVRVRELVESYPPGSDFARSGAQALFARTLAGPA
jgi:hypothetical protein